VKVSVSPETVAEAIGGVELGGGCGNGQLLEAVPWNEQKGTSEGVAVGTCAPQAQSSVKARTGARRRNRKPNGGEG
jgi:hypothetical protein